MLSFTERWAYLVVSDHIIFEAPVTYWPDDADSTGGQQKWQMKDASLTSCYSAHAAGRPPICRPLQLLAAVRADVRAERDVQTNGF